MGHCSCNHCHTERKRKISPYLLPAISFGMLLGGIAMQVPSDLYGMHSLICRSDFR